MQYDYDFAIIGGGSAGYAAARTAISAGLKTAVIEGGDEVAGLCILRGCMPSKTLLESANRANVIKNAAEFGLHAEKFSAEPAAIIARKRRLISEFADYRRDQLETGDFDFIRARATFSDPHTLELTDVADGTRRTITARTTLIATGSTFKEVPIPGLEHPGILTSDDVLDLTELPASMTVLGAGPVALELAHYLHAVGTAVTVIQRSDQVLSWFDPDMTSPVTEAYRERGMTVHLGTQVTKIEATADGYRVHFERDGTASSIDTSAVLNGLGRKPNLDPLRLDRASVDLAKQGVAVRPTMQSASAPHVFAAGDVCGPFEIVHLAVTQGEIAARNAARFLRGEPADTFEEMDYRLALFGVFTEPQVAAVGLSETNAKRKGIPVVTASYPFNDHGKSLVMGELHGSVKLLASPETGEILGGAVTGPHATDLIHEIVVAMAFRSTAAQLATIPHYHPTLSEIWTYPAEDLADQIASYRAGDIVPSPS